jgi:hypothetical protein
MDHQRATPCLRPNGAADNSQGREPLDRDEAYKGTRPNGAALRAPPRWGGRRAIPVVEFQGLPPLAIVERPVGAKGSRLLSWFVVLVVCAAVAHGCHIGDHGDADLLIRLVTDGE